MAKKRTRTLNPKFVTPTGEIVEMEEAMGRRLGLRREAGWKIWKRPTGYVTVTNPKGGVKMARKRTRRPRKTKILGVPVMTVAILGGLAWWLAKKQ